VEELGLPDLTTKQVEEVCSEAEEAARRYILSKVHSKMLEKMNIIVEANGTKPLNITVEIDLALSPKIKRFDVNTLVKNATKEAFRASENYLRKL